MRAKRKRQPYSALDAMSKGQRELGDILHELFPTYRIYFEYSYYDILMGAIKRNKTQQKVYTTYYLNLGKRYKADWIVLDLQLVFEYQGRQHYQPVAFGGDHDEANKRFLEQRVTDKNKRLIVVEAEWDIVEVPHFAKLTKDNVLKWCTARKYSE